MTFQRRLLLAAGGGWLFDAMDLLVLGSVLAAVGRAWDLPKPVVGWIITANLLGMFLGAAASGVVADRFGRTAVFAWTLLAYTLLTGLTALAWSVSALIAIRLLAGIGLGGELPVASTLVSELAPAQSRGRTVVLLESFWAYGTVVAALIGALVVPHWGWRVALLIGMLPALYVAVIRRAVPESPRYLASRGRTLEAREVARRAGIAYEPPAAAPRAGIADLFSRTFAKRTVMLWLLWIALVFSYYGIFTWLPSLLTAKGFTLEQSLWLNLAIALFQIPGYFAAA
ncbi:MAG TPA: MFS transporter, partial [Candidatus Elarobacter sp.]|nr:MFS transporter [Candidatus Elarobacter sp.]